MQLYNHWYYAEEELGAESDFKFNPEVIFMLDENAPACIIKEGIDEGKIIIMDGLDFLKSTQPNVKKL